jgi:type IV pilus assembly protein PilP
VTDDFFKRALSPHGRPLLWIVVVVCLTACGHHDQNELQTWMDQARAQTPVTVKKLVPPVQFVPAAYTLAGELDPFDPQKLKSALAKARAAAGANSLQPDLNRRREALEAVPLDGLRFVGYVVKNNKSIALIAAQGGLYNVKVGNYLGTDFGRVVALAERELTLKELVQDGSGEWSERITKLPMQEASKEGKK